MAAIPGFKYDIFISYAHNDNHCPTNAPGWVDSFHDALEGWLKYRRGLSDLTIWRDKKLDGNIKFDIAIEERIQRSALFFVLNSRNYIRSDYCRKELRAFQTHHSARYGGLIVGEYSRIFNILLNNIPYQQWPDELRGTAGFVMHDSQSSDELGDFTSPYDSRFEKQLRHVVDATEATLEEFSKLSHNEKESQIQTAKRAEQTVKRSEQMGDIFISYSRENKEFVQRLADYLERESLSVWVDNRIDYGARWWKTVVEKIRECAAMIVVMTPESENSKWVEREMMYADKIEKHLFPLLLKGECFPLLINHQYHDVRDGSLPPEEFVITLKKICR